ncbi:MAG: hypothetical protein A3J75_01795 [Acidobacteria bacterium RBG_16_68_9]|nr:MAG: hypothetical protein A3J75_01795 [Acidobacteria bacterium RBG_16_68_9]
MARIAVGALGKEVHRLRLDGKPTLTETPVAIRERAPDNRTDVLRRQRLQDEDGGPRQQRRDDLKRGVLRGRADEHQGAVLDMRQEGILLCLVEAMDLVNDQYRGAPVVGSLRPRLLDHVAQLLHPGEHGREVNARRIRGLGEQMGEGGLSAPRRSP